MMAGKAGKTTGKLSALAVTNANRPGLFNDGNGLYLKVDEGGSKSWVLRYKVAGRSRKFGLGATHTVGLALARDKAAAARRLLLDGHDPINEKRKAKAAVRLQEAKSISFDDCAAAYIEINKPAWRNPKHVYEWGATLQRYASPIFGKLAVADIDTGMVVLALEKIWVTKAETASRVRGRIESVLDYAKARGFRAGENPAAWKGNLDHILPPHAKIKAKQHHPAMPHAEVLALMTTLATRHETSAAALGFTILTAARSGEVLGAQWTEIDLNARLWTLPAQRVKSGREHRVPLSDAALGVLQKMQAIKSSGYVFPSEMKRGRGLSVTVMPVLLRRLGHHAATVHGFRSSFRDWAAEETSAPREVAEACLAHVVKDRTEAAYRRTDFLERRRQLMDAWAHYVTSPPSDKRKVVSLHDRRGE